MNFKRLLSTEMGRFFISVLLGLGLATLFRQVCTGDKCLTFNGPVNPSKLGYFRGNPC